MASKSPRRKGRKKVPALAVASVALLGGAATAHAKPVDIYNPFPPYQAEIVAGNNTLWVANLTDSGITYYPENFYIKVGNNSHTQYEFCVSLPQYLGTPSETWTYSIQYNEASYNAIVRISGDQHCPPAHGDQYTVGAGSGGNINWKQV